MKKRTELQNEGRKNNCQLYIIDSGGLVMNNSGNNFDPLQMASRFREILAKGDPSELQDYLQDILTQYGAIPLAQAFLTPLVQMLAGSISQYISGFMGRPAYTSSSEETPEATEAENSANKPRSINSMLFEIHGFVVIRANIPEEVNVRDIKVFYSPGYITIKGDPSGEDHVVQLPPGSMQEGATAAIKDRILEIRIPKESTEVPENEIGIEEI